MKEKLNFEYDLYEFVRQRFHFLKYELNRKTVT